MKKLVLLFLLFTTQVIAEDLDKRHDGSVFSCNEIRADYVTSGKEVFFKEYQEWCKGSKLYPYAELSRGEVNPTGNFIELRKQL